MPADKEIFERHVKLQADSRRTRGMRDSIMIFIGLKKLLPIMTAHALYRDNGPLNGMMAGYWPASLFVCLCLGP